MIAQHTKVHNYLLSLIKKGHEGDMLPSQSELCSKFEVSIITVRRALDDVEKKGLIFRKKGKGTFIKKAKPVVKSIKICMILPLNQNINDEFISGIILQSQKSRTALYIYHYNHDDVELEEMIQNNPPDGIMWVAPDDAQSISMAEKFREKGFAVMVFNRVMKNTHLNYVSSNNAGGIKEITELFINHGRKRIAFLGRDELLGYSNSRFLAFQEAVDNADAGIETFTVPVSCKNYHYGDLYMPISEMLDSFKPDAIMCSQGFFMDDLLDVTRQRNLNIPLDIEVGTYNCISPDNPEKAFIHEIDQGIKVMGTLALIELESIIKGIKGKSRLIMKPQVLRKERSK